MTSPRPPARIDRAAFDRILQRAAELQASAHDIGDGVSEDEVMALGKEVGIPDQYLRQAMLEQRAQVAPMPPTTGLDSWVGVADVRADRVVQGSEADIARAITQRLEKYEHMVVQRAAPGRYVFEPMDQLASAMRKVGALLDTARGKPFLDKAELVTAVVTPLETGFAHVALSATLRRHRGYYVTGAAALGGTGVAGAGVLAVLIPAATAVAAVAVAAPLIAGGTLAWLTLRSYRVVPTRAQTGLERILDELERAPAVPPGQARIRGVADVVRDIGREVRKAIES